MFEVSWLFLKWFSFSLFLLAGILLPLLTVIFVIGIWQGRIDQRPWRDAIYMAFITALTVGYGDMTPRKPLSRLLSVLLAFIGMVLVGIIVSGATTATTLAIENSEAHNALIERITTEKKRDTSEQQAD